MNALGWQDYALGALGAIGFLALVVLAWKTPKGDDGSDDPRPNDRDAW